MSDLLNIVNGMDPEKALLEIGNAVKSLFAVLSEASRSRFLMDLVGESQDDKVSSLVHL
jgi:hypothetical protein